MKLQAKAFGVACGVTLGLVGLVATLFSIWRGGGQTLSVLAAVYFGYRPSLVGALVALFWGIVYGGIGGWFFAFVYNRVVGRGGAASAHGGPVE